MAFSVIALGGAATVAGLTIAGRSASGGAATIRVDGSSRSVASVVAESPWFDGNATEEKIESIISAVEGRRDYGVIYLKDCQFRLFKWSDYCPRNMQSYALEYGAIIAAMKLEPNWEPIKAASDWRWFAYRNCDAFATNKDAALLLRESLVRNSLKEFEAYVKRSHLDFDKLIDDNNKPAAGSEPERWRR